MSNFIYDGWLEPDGTFHKLRNLNYNTWAADRIMKLKHEGIISFEEFRSYRQQPPEEVLLERGWILIQVNKDNKLNISSKLAYLTKKQKDFLYESYNNNNLTEKAIELYNK